jgi:membrane-bound lytic murein transglycosylase MltF
VLTGVSEVVVTGPASPPAATLDDLAGNEVVVRRSSSYFESLQTLNASFKAGGKREAVLTPANENLEDEDLLEMVNAGLLPVTVVDSHLAQFWSQVFRDITVHEKLTIRTGGQIAWAIRKESPQFKRALNEFVQSHKKGTAFGNTLFNRYLRSAKYARNSGSPEDLRRFRQTVELFKKYATQYDFDWLLVAAQAYQESRLDQSLRSPAGAVGVMQVLPRTAAGAPINIRDIEVLENNIHAGVAYLRYLRDRYFDDADIDPLNRQLFAFASYNAGPARVAGLRKKAKTMGLDPNKWFRNVEIVAAREIGRETVDYVAHILMYYVAYDRVVARESQRPKTSAP